MSKNPSTPNTLQPNQLFGMQPSKQNLQELLILNAFTEDLCFSANRPPVGLTRRERLLFHINDALKILEEDEDLFNTESSEKEQDILQRLNNKKTPGS
jgi:hypothetical protein